MEAGGGAGARLGALNLVNEAKARALLAEHRPDLTSRRAELLDDGWEFLVLAFDDVVARFPRRPTASWKFGIEIGLLPILAEALPVAVPVHEFVARDGDVPIFSLDPRIAGDTLTDELVESVDVEQTAADLGRALSSLHAVPLKHAEAAGLPTNDSAAWRNLYAEFGRRIIDGPVAGRDKAIAHRIVSAIEGFTARDDRFAPAIVHADLGGQIFVEHSSGRVTGIIDWADTVVGDPAIDMGALLEYGEPFVRYVLDVYDGADDPTLLERARFYDALSPVSGFVGAVALEYPRQAAICWAETVNRWS